MIDWLNWCMLLWIFILQCAFFLSFFLLFFLLIFIHTNWTLIIKCYYLRLLIYKKKKKKKREFIVYTKFTRFFFYLFMVLRTKWNSLVDGFEFMEQAKCLNENTHMQTLICSNNYDWMTFDPKLWWGHWLVWTWKKTRRLMSGNLFPEMF